MDQPEEDVPGLWVVLPTVAEAIDEQGLSKPEALAMLREMVSEQPPSEEMRRTVSRLERAADEFELRLMLGEECMRLMDLDDACS